MKNYFIFEDKSSSPVSRLISSSFNGSSYLFSGGAPNLSSTVKSVINDEDNFYVLMDVVPNNPITIEWYWGLKEEMSIYSNVFIFPIICMEYYLLNMLVTFGYIKSTEEIQGVVFDFDAEVVQSYVSSSGCKPSIEKVCKNLVATLQEKCKRNTNKSRNPLFGLFYLQDCVCDRKYCRYKCSDSVMLKSERLCCSLPIFDVVSDEHKKFLEDNGLSSTSVSFDEVFKSQKELINSICDELGVSKIMF